MLGYEDKQNLIKDSRDAVKLKPVEANRNINNSRHMLIRKKVWFFLYLCI